ncbi:MAG: hypothetical protein R3B09_10015 [Nannocystaceae bacterium]
MSKGLLQLALSSGLLLGGLLWGRGALRRWGEYSFAEDLRSTFLRPRWTYSADLLDGTPRLIAPAMVVAAGLGLLVWSVVRHLAG